MLVRIKKIYIYTYYIYMKINTLKINSTFVWSLLAVQNLVIDGCDSTTKFLGLARTRVTDPVEIGHIQQLEKP